MNKSKGRKSRKAQKQNKNSRDNITGGSRTNGEIVSAGAMLQPNKFLNQYTTYRFIQYVGNIDVAQATSDSFYSQSYTLAFLDQVSSFTSIFDQYRIKRIDVTFRPMYTATSLISSSSAAVIAPLIYVAADYDDDSAWTSRTQANAYQNLIVSDDKKPFTLSFIPHIALGAYSGSVFTSFANDGPHWIDCASTGVKHYGWKACVLAQTGTSTDLQQWNVSTRLHVDFMNVR
jgi:hypothetical protein